MDSLLEEEYDLTKSKEEMVGTIKDCILAFLGIDVFFSLLIQDSSITTSPGFKITFFYMLLTPKSISKADHFSGLL